MTAAIEIRGLTVEYGSGRRRVRALDGLDLTINTGHVFGFIGPNGAGKTTTMHVLLGFILPAAGEARIFGDDVRRSVARERIGYLPENPDAYRFLTGRELLISSGRLFSMRGRALRNRADEVLELVGLAREAASRRIATYSRGMMQRICLAQSLINDPDLVILDEPTGGLDPFARIAFREIVSGLRERGKTVFFSSHELSEVETVCDRLAIVAGGRVITEGAVSEVVPAGERLERYFLRTVRDAEARGA